MIASLQTTSAVVAASALLLPAISASAALVDLPSDTPEIPGVILSGTSGLTGTVIADQTVAFSMALNPYNMEDAYTICLRNSTARVPVYLVRSYFMVPGAVSGPCEGPLQRPPVNLEGTLRSLIVDRGGQRDYYYQLKNTSSLPTGSGADIFRLTIGGFSESETLSVSYSLDGLAGLLGAGAWVPGTKAPYSADRIPAMPFVATGRNIGFDFDASHFLNTNLGGPSNAPGNVDPSETSFFLVVRTSQTAPAAGMGGGDAVTSVGPAVIVGAGALVANAYAPGAVPEPAALLLAGLGMLAAASSRPKR